MTKTLLVAMLLGFGFVSLLVVCRNAFIWLVEWVFNGPTWRGWLFFSILFSALLFWAFTNGR